MRRLVVTENITVDGVVENTGFFDPTADDEQGRELAAMTREQAAASDAFLVGRVTFEEMRGFWPQQKDDMTGVTDHLNRVAKYVVSSSMDDPQWEGTTVLRGGDNLSTEIEDMKAAHGTDIVIAGSIDLSRQLLALGLVDELRLIVHPTVVGRGRRLFPDGTELDDLELVESRQFSAGVVLLRYARHAASSPAGGDT